MVCGESVLFLLLLHVFSVITVVEAPEYAVELRLAVYTERSSIKP